MICDICQDKKVTCNCDICCKVLCHHCRTFDNLGKFIDYDGTFCQRCWDMGTPYRKLEGEAQEICDLAFEDIWLEWKKEATKDLTD